jgi:DNA replicative helicase MCM subunit Mcm2 (Cdc46/Mcm family)
LTKSQFNNFDFEEDFFKEGEKRHEIELITVGQALRENFGIWKVKGTIIGISKLFKMISKIEFYCDNCAKLIEIDYLPPVFDIANVDKRCNQCNEFRINNKNNLNPIFKNAVTVELQDSETFNDMDKLSVFLFDNDTEGIMVGETVIIKGDIEVINNKKRYYPNLYGESIQYLNREDLSLTKLDIEAIKRFRNLKSENKIIDELVSMFDHSIVGYDHAKKGILCSAVNTSTRLNKSEHLDALLIGDPGLAKTKLLKRATELVPGSSMESAQNSSGKSITAIIEKAEENTFLRLGAVPRARGAICGLNEIARMSYEDQAHLLDVMQEREFTINKHGINARIRSPTTIIGSANPVNRSTWKDNDKVDLNEFSILEPIIDRFDLKFVFRKRKSQEENDEFVDKLSEVEDKKDKGRIPDYTSFLIKYIQYAKQFKPIITEEARTMLKDFYKHVSLKDFGSPRVLITLFKLAKAIARLKLKEIADETDAKEVMEFYNVILVDFQKSVVISQSPRDLAYNECISLLEQFKEFEGIQLEELITMICQRNKQLANYFEYDKTNKSFKIENNKKVRRVYEMLLNHSKIIKVQEKPIVLKWLSDPTDLSDPVTKEKNQKLNDEKQNNSESRSVKSDRSDKNDILDNSMKFIKTSSNRKQQSIEMTSEQYDSWIGRDEKKKKEKEENDNEPNIILSKTEESTEEKYLREQEEIKSWKEGLNN